MGRPVCIGLSVRCTGKMTYIVVVVVVVVVVDIYWGPVWSDWVRWGPIG